MSETTCGPLDRRCARPDCPICTAVAPASTPDALAEYDREYTSATCYVCRAHWEERDRLAARVRELEADAALIDWLESQEGDVEADLRPADLPSDYEAWHSVTISWKQNGAAPALPLRDVLRAAMRPRAARSTTEDPA